MWRNFKLNHDMVISGFETLFLGAYLIYVQNVFVLNHPDPHVRHLARILSHAQDPLLAILLICVGTLTILVGLWNVRRFWAKRVAISSMVAIWSSYFVAFLWRDINRPGPLGFSTILIGVVIIRLLIEARWGDSQ